MEFDIWDDEAFQEKYFRKPQRELDKKIDAHNKYRESKEFQDAIRYLVSITRSFNHMVDTIALYSTRSPYPDPLSISMRSYFLQSTFGVLKLVEEGLFGPARRELRFLLESAVKFQVLDQLHDTLEPGEKLKKLDELPGKFKEVVDLYMPPWGTSQTSKNFKNELTSLYGNLSILIHTSKVQVEKDFKDFERGQYFGFEDVATLNQFNSLAFRVYDLALVLFFHTIGLGMVGDIFLALDTVPKWPFQKGRFIKELDRFYDYKAERNDPHYWNDKFPKRPEHIKPKDSC